MLSNWTIWFFYTLCESSTISKLTYSPRSVHFTSKSANIAPIIVFLNTPCDIVKSSTIKMASLAGCVSPISIEKIEIYPVVSSREGTMLYFCDSSGRKARAIFNRHLHGKQVSRIICFPAYTGRLPNAVSMVGHRLRCCPNIKTTLYCVQ